MDNRILRFLEETPSNHLYNHKPLETADSFRLVKILPGIGDENIVVEVSNHRLSDAPSYSALSYTWGKETRIVYISCGGFDLPVTETLVDAIRVFRLSDHSRMFWIDQCCIDQSNVHERSKQVSLMCSIYASAQTVQAWLGSDPLRQGPSLQTLLMQIDLAIDSIATRGAEHLARGDEVLFTAAEASIPGSKPVYDLTKALPAFAAADFFKRHGLPLADSSDWKSLWACLLSTYFSRVWIVQEIHASQVARLHWGRSELHWPLLYNAIRFCETYFIHQDLVDKPPHNWRTFVAPFIKEKGGRRGSLFRYLLETAFHECSNKKDKVFGLLGVYSTIGVSYDHLEQDAHEAETAERLQADYNLTWQEVIRDTCKAICYASTHLEILCYVSHDSIPPTNGLPSWSFWPSRETHIPEVDSGFFYSNLIACGRSRPQLGDRSHDVQDILKARGLRVDRVTAVTDAIPFRYHESTQAYLPDAGLFEDAWTLMKSSVINDKQDPRELDPAVTALICRVPEFVETLCCDSHERITSEEIRSENVYLYAAYQIESALDGVRAYCREPTNPRLRSELFFPDSGIFAAMCAISLDAVSHNPDVIRNTMRSHVAADLDRCLKLVDHIFESSAADEKDARFQSLVFALCVVRQRNLDWRKFGSKCWDGKERIFFLTARGNIGRGSKMSQPEDCICILYGGPVPFIFRAREDGANWFVGACYLQGMMDGEAIEGRDEMGLLEEDFIFA